MLDAFPDPLCSDVTLMVMPYLRPCDDPPFGIIGEIVDFIDQTLEVLLYPATSSYSSCLLRDRAWRSFIGISLHTGEKLL